MNFKILLTGRTEIEIHTFSKSKFIMKAALKFIVVIESIVPYGESVKKYSL